MKTVNAPTRKSNLPRHVAVIMDGNGRWANQRNQPRSNGHRAGVEALRKTITCCAELGIEVLTVFAFSQENWKRPAKEVSLLMSLFLTTLKKQTRVLHKNNIRLRIIGDRSAFSDKLQTKIREAEMMTHENTGLNVQIAANYGGQWDVTQAANQVMAKIQSGDVSESELTEELIQAHLSFADLPEPDLFIRTGGEHRISNFMLWQLAYTELHFTDTLWPDFDEKEFNTALEEFSQRQRRFGRTGEQVLAESKSSTQNL